MIRRRFILKAGGALVAAGSASLLDAPNVIAQPKFQWRMSTTWTPALDMLQGSAQRLGKPRAARVTSHPNAQRGH
jgi:TRAP-type mannitol/chloroaromatic compound transport system substrate-binding protein